MPSTGWRALLDADGYVRVEERIDAVRAIAAAPPAARTGCAT